MLAGLAGCAVQARTGQAVQVADGGALLCLDLVMLCRSLYLLSLNFQL